MMTTHYDIRILKTGERSFKTTQYKTVAENEKYIILNDTEFTKLNKKDRGFSRLNNVINKSSISEWKLGFSLDGLHYTLYTNKSKRLETIKKEITEWINENYAYLYQVNLDFIK